jgi:hypothetical protein
MAFPAFKEWNAVVQALGAGAQILILRKGGIAEGRGGFQMKAERFWLFPTAFHAQAEKLKPAAERWLSSPHLEAEKVPIRFFAEAVQTKFLENWDDILRLEPFHLWTTETVKDRFEWSKPPGLFAFVVRVFALPEPHLLSVSPEMSGCKSWIELPFSFDATPSMPVLTDSEFSARLRNLPF